MALIILITWMGMRYVTTTPAGPDKFSEYVIKKGSHWSRPYVWSYKNRSSLKYQFVFDESARYDLKDNDQKDWNKLTGLSRHLWTNHKDAAMVSWRYNPASKLIELGAYFHKDGQTIKAKINGSEVMGVAKIGSSAKAIIDIITKDNTNAIQITIITTDTALIRQPFGVDLDHKMREINGWFGGNRSAPQDIYINKRTIE